MNKGFTLLETMIAFMIITILMLYAVPSFNEIREQQDIDDAVLDLLVRIVFVKDEAFSSSEFYVIQSSDSTFSWDSWEITDNNGFTDSFNNPDISITSTVSGLTFNASGFMANEVGIPVFGASFDVCHSNDTLGGKRIDVLASGAIEVEDINCGA